MSGPARRTTPLTTVPPAGFEPAISALKGLRPGPLDDEGGLRLLGLMYRSRQSEQGVDGVFSVAEIVESEVRAVCFELGSREIAGRNCDDPCSACASAG